MNPKEYGKIFYIEHKDPVYCAKSFSDFIDHIEVDEERKDGLGPWIIKSRVEYKKEEEKEKNFKTGRCSIIAILSEPSTRFFDRVIGTNRLLSNNPKKVLLFKTNKVVRWKRKSVSGKWTLPTYEFNGGEDNIVDLPELIYDILKDEFYYDTSNDVELINLDDDVWKNMFVMINSDRTRIHIIATSLATDLDSVSEQYKKDLLVTNLKNLPRDLEAESVEILENLQNYISGKRSGWEIIPISKMERVKL